MRNFWNVKPLKLSSSMKPIKAKSMFNIARPVKFSTFGLTETPVPRKPNKNLSYPQAKMRYSGLSPFGDWDRDGRVNIFDCRPFDFYRHKVPKEHSAREVKTYARPGATFYDIFRDAEEQLPRLYNQSKAEKNNFLGHFGSRYGSRKHENWEDEYSDRLTDALMGRESVHSSPVQDIVGTYTIDIPLHPGKIMGIFEYLDETLSRIYPNKEFIFSLEDPTAAKVIDYEIPIGQPGRESRQRLGRIFSELEDDIKTLEKLGKLYEQSKAYPKTLKQVGFHRPDELDISKLTSVDFLKRNLKHMRGLMNELQSRGKAYIVISDYPVDILRKSSNQGWRSCERLTPWEGDNHPFDLKHEKCPNCSEWGRGQFEAGPFSDIKNWHAVAYYYLGGKKPGKGVRPSGRTMIRWGYNQYTEEPDIAIEGTIYPLNAGDGLGAGRDRELAAFLLYKLQEILQKKGYSKGDNIEAEIGEAYSDTGKDRYDGRVLYETGIFRKPSVNPTQTVHDWKKSFASGAPEASFIPFLSTESEPGIIKGISRHKRLPKGRIGAYSRHPEEKIRYEITQRTEKLEPEVQERLIKDPVSTVRTGILSYRKYAPDVGEEIDIYRDIPEEKRKEILSNANVASNILHRKNIPEDILNLLVGHKDYTIRKQFANKQDISLNYIKILLKDDNPEVLSALIDQHNEKIKKSKQCINILKRRFKTGSQDIKQVILSHLSILPETFIKEALSEMSNDEKVILAGSTSLQLEIATRLSRIPDERILYALFSNPFLFDVIGHELSRELMSNSLPIAIKNGFRDLVYKMAVKPFINDSHAKQMLDYAVKNNDNEILKRLAYKSYLSPKLVEKIAVIGVESGDRGVLSNLYNNPTVPSEIREQIKEMMLES